MACRAEQTCSGRIKGLEAKTHQSTVSVRNPLSNIPRASSAFSNKKHLLTKKPKAKFPARKIPQSHPSDLNRIYRAGKIHVSAFNASGSMAYSKYETDIEAENVWQWVVKASLLECRIASACNRLLSCVPSIFKSSSPVQRHYTTQWNQNFKFFFKFKIAILINYQLLLFKLIHRSDWFLACSSHFFVSLHRINLSRQLHFQAFWIIVWQNLLFPY